MATLKRDFLARQRCNVYQKDAKLSREHGVRVLRKEYAAASIIVLIQALGSVSYAQSVTTTFGYDPTGQVVSKTDTIGNQTTYAYDKAGNRTQYGLVAVHLPIATADAVSTPANTALTFNPLANDSDPDGRTLAIVATSGAGHGTVSFTANSVTYTPATDYFGADTLSYTISDGRPLTATAQISINVVRPAAPLAGNVSLSTSYNTAGSVSLAPTGSYTGLAIAAAPAHGSASINGAAATYTPAAGYYGSDSFTYVASGLGGVSAPGLVSVSVGLPPAPTVAPTSLAVSYNTPGSGPLLPSGLYSGLSVVDAPIHGAVTINGASATYTPSAGYYGADSFTYRATGPGGQSAPAGVSVAVANPAAPVTAGVSLNVAYNTAGSVALAPSGVYTSLAVATQPAHGSASISGTTATYTPTAGYYGADAFTYTATGPGGTGNGATVSVTVAVPAAPTVSPVSLTTAYNTGGAVALNGSGVIQSYAVASGPAHGSASISGGSLNYTPAAGYYGADSLTYTATGPGGVSSAAPLSITVGLPARPGASPVGLSVGYGASGAVALSPSGVYSGLSITAGPSHGSASISGTTLTYTPTAGYYGADSLNYISTGPGGSSDPAGVSISVSTPPAPTAQAVSFSVPFATGGAGSLAPAGVYTSLALATGPAHGSVSVNGATATYVPSVDFFGADSFTYTVSGPGGVSAPGTAYVTVGDPAYPTGTVLTPSYSGSNFTVLVPVGALHHVQVTCRGGDGGGSATYSGGAGGKSVINVEVVPGSTVITGTLGAGGSYGSNAGTSGTATTCTSSSSNPTFTLVDNGGAGGLKTRAGSGGSASGGTSNSTGTTGGGSGRSGSVSVVVTTN